MIRIGIMPLFQADRLSIQNKMLEMTMYLHGHFLCTSFFFICFNTCCCIILVDTLYAKIWYTILIFRTEQKIRYVHRLNALKISSCKFICPEYIFGVVVVYLQQAVVLPFFRFFRMNLLCNLHIQLIVLSRCYKVDFSASCLAL